MFKFRAEFLTFLLLQTSFTFTLIHAQQFNANKLNVLVLYESLCPDSIKFMAQNLGPNHESLKDYIDLTLVPFGKSYSINNGSEFFCQHGPGECRGNRMQSCVLQQTTDQALQVRFAVCQMTAPDKSNVKYCAEAVGLSGDIEQCMSSTAGTQLQLQAEQLTRAYAPTFVPTVIYDGVFDQGLQDASIRNFRGTVCGLLQKRGAVSFNSPVCQ